MSVLATLPARDGRVTWIGSDTMVCSGMLRQEIGPKWVLRPPWAVGVAGNLRTLNAVEERADALLADLEGPHAFARRARELLQEDGYRPGEDGQGPLDLGQVFMLARPGAAWTIGCDFALLPVPAGTLWAEGEGRELALGAARALQGLERAPAEPEVMRRALAIAIELGLGCGGRPWLAALDDGGWHRLD